MAIGEDGRKPLPRYDSDEVARLFASEA